MPTLDDLIPISLAGSLLAHLGTLYGLLNMGIKRDFWKDEARRQQDFGEHMMKRYNEMVDTNTGLTEENKRFYGMACSYYDRIIVLEQTLKRNNIPLPGWEVADANNIKSR